MTKRRGLGKGLAELIPQAAPPREGEQVLDLALDAIAPNPFQPRREFDPQELAELAESIKVQGLLQPVIVREVEPGRFQVVAGERRLRATRNLGLTKIRAIVRELDDRQMLELSLIENLIRADLNEIEVAEGLASLQNRYGYTTTELAEVIGKSRPAVSNTLRLLELPSGIKDLVRNGKLSAGHGRAVLSFPAADRERIAEECATAGWSVRELERRAAVDTARKPVKRPRQSARRIEEQPPASKRIEEQLMEHLGTKVRVSEQGGTGRIEITYHGEEDLRRILSLLLEGSNPV
jgi:ParB family chromosome partitioning protein